MPTARSDSPEQLDRLRSSARVTACAVVGGAVMATALLASCASPYNDDAREALGPEADGVEEGPLHRPGQPCLVCHGGYGGEPDFAVAGTIFNTIAATDGLAGVNVIITDSLGEVVSRGTNQAGNFYIYLDDWEPAFPLRAEMDCPTPEGPQRVVMATRIGRDGSCAACHFDAPGPASVGKVYCP